mmetsp:Transcript_22140/g.65653  ORF Transcript_22140/g.65653 Transcript_22140/m.65653 type:complete len:208 (+) Transcript_22140:198-821(+)
MANAAASLAEAAPGRATHTGSHTAAPSYPRCLPVGGRWHCPRTTGARASPRRGTEHASTLACDRRRMGPSRIALLDRRSSLPRPPPRARHRSTAGAAPARSGRREGYAAGKCRAARPSWAARKRRPSAARSRESGSRSRPACPAGHTRRRGRPHAQRGARRRGRRGRLCIAAVRVSARWRGPPPSPSRWRCKRACYTPQRRRLRGDR